MSFVGAIWMVMQITPLSRLTKETRCVTLTFNGFKRLAINLRLFLVFTYHCLALAGNRSILTLCMMVAGFPGWQKYLNWTFCCVVKPDWQNRPCSRWPAFLFSEAPAFGLSLWFFSCWRKPFKEYWHVVPLVRITCGPKCWDLIFVK